MPPKSKKQERFMAAVANNPKFANKVGVPQNVGAKFMKKKPKKNYMGGGMMKRYNEGGKLEMVEKDGKKVPFFAADGKGKMRAGGKVMKYQEGREVTLPAIQGDNMSSKRLEDMAQKAMPQGDNMSSERLKEMAEKAMKSKNKTRRKPKRMMGGGKVKKGYKNGGKVRGCGMARQGVRPAKMVKMKGA